ncbi:histone H1 [bacterium]|nr:histone H1 [bacterium]
MADNTDNILDQWEEIKTLVESLELDVHKNARGNKSAGVRARRGLRDLKTRAANLVRTTISAEKE